MKSDILLSLNNLPKPLRIRRILVFRVLLAASTALSAGIVVPCAGAQSSHSDSAVTTRPWLTKRDAVAGAVAVLATVAIVPLDTRTAGAMQAQRFQSSEDLQRAARQFAFLGGPGPFLMGAGLFSAGRIIRIPRLADAGLHMTEAVLLAASITGLGKGIFGRAVPAVNVNDPANFMFGRGFHEENGPYVSFPAGHATASFAMAAALTSEADRWRPGAARILGPIAYGSAALVGLARMYQNVHWASDFPLAVAVGTWSGLTVVGRSHPHARQADTPTGDLPAALVEMLRSTTVLPIAGQGAALSWSIPLELRSRSPGP